MDLSPLQAWYAIEIAIDVDQGGGIVDGRRRDPSVVFAEAHAAFGQEPIEGSRAERDRFGERDFSQSSQEEADGFFVTTACQFPHRHGRASEIFSPVATQKVSHEPDPAICELVFEIDQNARIKEQHAVS